MPTVSQSSAAVWSWTQTCWQGSQLSGTVCCDSGRRREFTLSGWTNQRRLAVLPGPDIICLRPVSDSEQWRHTAAAVSRCHTRHSPVDQQTAGAYFRRSSTLVLQTWQSSKIWSHRRHWIKRDVNITLAFQAVNSLCCQWWMKPEMEIGLKRAARSGFWFMLVLCRTISSQLAILASFWESSHSCHCRVGRRRWRRICHSHWIDRVRQKTQLRL